MDTAETEQEDWPPADFWVRGGAYVLDALLLSPVLWMGRGVLGHSGLLVSVVYHTVCVGLWGQTLGKAVAGVQVVRLDGGPAGLGRALLRDLGGYVSTSLLGCGYWMAAFTPQRRALHDYIAGTKVIYPSPIGAGRRTAFTVLGLLSFLFPLIGLWALARLFGHWH